MGYNITLGIGVILFAASIYCLQKSFDFLKTSDRAKGVVQELEVIEDSDGKAYKAIFKFTTSAGEEIRFKQASSSNPAGWNVGEETVVAYRADDPTSARPMTYFGIFSWSIILMAISMPFIIVGGGYRVAQLFLK